MTSKLNSDQLEQLLPLLADLSDLIASGIQISKDKKNIKRLIKSLELDPTNDLLNESIKWAYFLEEVSKSPDSNTQLTIIKCLKNRGLPDAPVKLAIDRVVSSQSKKNTTGQDPSLIVSTKHLNLGTITAEMSAFGEFTVLAGGPGRVIVEDDDRIHVEPSEFGVSPTPIKIEIKPMVGGGVSFNKMRLISEQGESIDVDVAVDWSNVTVTQPDVTQTSNKPSKPPTSPDPVRQPQIVKEGRKAKPPQPVKAPFRFRNGSEASTLEELVKLCVENPTDGAYHLITGDFEPWLRDIGKTDLASIAENTRKSSGADFQKLKLFLDHTNIKHNFIPLPDIGWGKFISVGLSNAMGGAVIGVMLGGGLASFKYASKRLAFQQQTWINFVVVGIIFFLLLILFYRNPLLARYRLAFWLFFVVFLLLITWPSIAVVMAGIFGFSYFFIFADEISKQSMLGTIFTITQTPKSRVLYIIILSPIYVLGTWLSVIIAQQPDIVHGALWMGIVSACITLFYGVIRLFAEADY